MKLYVEGVGLLGPGLHDWDSAAPLLAADGAKWQHAEVKLPAADLLPAAERRRVTAPVRLAMAVCREAVVRAEAPADHLPTVFASSSGDGETITQILRTLTLPVRAISPTAFHNSVHNAPAGYWSIATRCRAASMSLCAYDWSFAAGLIETGAQALTADCQVLLAAYEIPYPPPLDGVRAIRDAFGVALLLSPQQGARSLASLSLHLAGTRAAESTLIHAGLEQIRQHNPAARALPLLSALASGERRSLALDSVAGNTLTIDVEPLTGCVA